MTKSKSSLTLCQSAILSSFPALSCQGGDTYGNHNSVQLRFRLQRSRRYMFHILRASAFKDHPRSRKISIGTCIWKCAQCALHMLFLNAYRNTNTHNYKYTDTRCLGGPSSFTPFRCSGRVTHVLIHHGLTSRKNTLTRANTLTQDNIIIHDNTITLTNTITCVFFGDGAGGGGITY